jgi:hypothetical protein
VGGRIVAIPFSLERIDTLGWFDFYDAIGFDGLALHVPLHWIVGEWTKRVAIGGSPPKLAYAAVEDYRIYVYDLTDYDLALVIQREGATHELTEADHATAQAGFEELMRRYVIHFDQQHRAADFQRTMEAADAMMPKRLSPIDRILIDEANYVWVAHRPGPGASAQVWAIYRGDGTFLGEMNLPREIDVREIGREYVLGVGKDASSVEFIAMHELRR